MTDFNGQLTAQLHEIEQQGQRRHLISVAHLDRGQIEIKGKRYLNLAGNDYLGLATDNELHRDFFQHMPQENRLENFGLGSTASRLMTGNTAPYQQLEEKLTNH